MTTRGASCRRIATSLLAAALASLFVPGIVRAQTALSSSDPASGATVPTSPDHLRLTFTQRPTLAMTAVAVRDSSGGIVPTTAVTRDSADTLSVRLVILAPLTDGRYTIRWKTAGPDEQHSEGQYAFRILKSVRSAMALARDSAVARSSAPVAEEAPLPRGGFRLNADSPVLMGFHLASLASLIAIIGAIVFQVAVFARTSGSDTEGRARMTAQLASHASRASMLFLGAAVARLLLQQVVFSTDAGTQLSLRAVVFGSSWGTSWIFQVAATVIAILGFAIAARRMSAGWYVAAVAAILLAFAMARGGHAGDTERFRALSILLDIVHILGAAGWVGSLFWFAAVGLPYVRSTGDGRAHRAGVLAAAYIPVAIIFAVIATLTGLLSAVLRVGHLRELFLSLYGQVLLAKIALVLVASGMGLYNWISVQPKLGEKSGASAQLVRISRLDLIYLTLVLVATAVIVAIPPPAG